MGKMLVPIFPEEDGGYRWFPNDRTATHISKEELPAVQRSIADQGRYSAVMTPDEWHRPAMPRRGRRRDGRGRGPRANDSGEGRLSRVRPLSSAVS